MKNRAIVFGFLLLAILAGGFFLTNRFQDNISLQAATDLVAPISTVTIGERHFVVEVAETSEAQSLGLGKRSTLAKNAGMLFPFQPPSQPSFWMKDMQFSIDIVWIRDGKIADISPNLPAPTAGTSAGSLPTYQPKTTIDFVLEINAGEAKNFSIGQAVTISDSMGV